jgi:hypothetical protein
VTDLEGSVTRIICPEYEDGTCRLEKAALEAVRWRNAAFVARARLVPQRIASPRTETQVMQQLLYALGVPDASLESIFQKFSRVSRLEPLATLASLHDPSDTSLCNLCTTVVSQAPFDLYNAAADSPVADQGCRAVTR